jgi:hypothetical protein
VERRIQIGIRGALSRCVDPVGNRTFDSGLKHRACHGIFFSVLRRIGATVLACIAASCSRAEPIREWRGFRMSGLPAGWTVNGDEIGFVPPADGARADLVTVAQYGDFELTLEWAVSEGGNSGIFFRVSEAASATYESGPEMQILDDERHPDGAKPETSAGANYGLHPPTIRAARPAGEFNEVKLIARGPHVEHFLNGVKVVEYELWTEDWKQRVAASKFAAWPSYGLAREGHIALQDHGDEVVFRNVRIRRLAE